MGDARYKKYAHEVITKARVLTLPLIFFCVTLCSHSAVCQEQQAAASPFVGEFFNTPVTMDNYNFIKGVIAVFGNKWGVLPTTEEELDRLIWEQLLLSYEAFRRGITVPEDEVYNEIDKILKSNNVEFNWKEDKDAYSEWVKNKMGGNTIIFENQLKHLLQIQKLRDKIMDSFDPSVSNKEAYQEFFNENNNLGVELVQFDELKDAKKFYNRVRWTRSNWDKLKEKGEYEFRETGSVSLEAHIDLWRIDRDAVYNMHKQKIGSLYPPAKVWKGYAVFKVLHRQDADKRRWEKFKDSYYEQIRRRKKMHGLWKWIEDLRKQANIKEYKK